MAGTYAETMPLIGIRSTAPLTDAARLMSDLSIGALAVEDERHELVGIVTERDLIWAMAQGKEASTTLVGEVMNDFPIIVKGPLTDLDAAEKMISAHVRHLIVTEKGQHRVVSMRDVMRDYVRDHAGPEATARDSTVARAELRRFFGAGAIGVTPR